jgi:ABC-type multidrug transport system permease subunit
MVGYYRTAANFFIFALIMFIISLAMSAQFRLLAILAPDAVVANAYSSLLVLAMVITSGFVIARSESPAPAPLAARLASCA